MGPAPRRLAPIFRDRDELPASGDLGAELTAALRNSMFLVVICSPASARSRWVGEEILAFKRIHGESRVLALIVDGAPYASNTPDKAELECFPTPLRFRLGPDGALSETPAEPIAADYRQEADGRRLAKLKLVAGLTGLRLSDLVQRETQRRMRRLAILSSASFTGMVLAGALALYANERRIEADTQRKIAERETATARAASDYLIGTFELINPATENPRTISALTLLSRGAERAKVELADQPVIHAQLLAALGEAYNNLGLAKEFSTVAQESMPAIQRAGPQGAATLVVLATAFMDQGQMGEALNAVKMAERLLGPNVKANLGLRADTEEMKGEILYNTGDPKGGLASLNRALALYRHTPDTKPRKLAVALKTRGLLLSDDGQFDQANASLTESLNILRRNLGDRDLVIGKAWYAVALNDLAANKFTPAEAAIRHALVIERAVLDPDNPTLANALSMEGQIYQGENKLDAAEKDLKSAIAVWQRAYGRPHYQIGIALVYLALVESAKGRTALALDDIALAKYNYDVSYGKLNPNHGDLLVNRAIILAKAGRRPEALADCAAGIKILDQTLGADASFTKSDADICKKM